MSAAELIHKAVLDIKANPEKEEEIIKELIKELNCMY